MLPKLACFSKTPVNLIGGERFPGVCDVCQSMPIERLDQNMDVIRHNHVFVQEVSLTFKVTKGALDDLGNLWVSQHTRAAALV